MKCLSVRQPWAWAIIHGGKDVENRNWYTKFRGTLAIHAGKSFDIPMDMFSQMGHGHFGQPYLSLALGYSKEYDSIGDDDPRGAIIGTVEVYDCIPDIYCDSPWKAEGDDFYCWLLRDPRALTDPIPMRGRLGLFDVPDGLFEEVRR